MARPGFPVPPDEIDVFQSGRRGWVNCTFYDDDLENLKAKRKAYFEKYPPQGYDTHTDGSIYKHPAGYWAVKIKRWSSCD